MGRIHRPFIIEDRRHAVKGHSWFQTPTSCCHNFTFILAYINDPLSEEALLMNNKIMVCTGKMCVKLNGEEAIEAVAVTIRNEIDQLGIQKSRLVLESV